MIGVGQHSIESRGGRAKSGEMQFFLGSLQCQLIPHERLHYGFAPHETRRSNMQISFQKHVQGMRNKMQNCQSFKPRVYINVITIVSALSVRINDLFIEEQCP